MKIEVSYIGLGKKDAEAIQTAFEAVEKAETKACGTMRLKLQERAPDFVGNQGKDIPDYLDGFGKVLGNTKKSEAKAVFKAWLVDADKVKSFAGVYNDWITECRKIRDSAIVPKTGDGDGPPIENPVKTIRKPTDKQFSEIEDRIPGMVAKQAETVINKAVSQLVAVTKENWEAVIVAQIQALAGRLQVSPEPIFHNLAVDVLEKTAKITKKPAAMDEAKKQNVPAPLEQIA